MAKEVVVGTLNTLYTAESIVNEPFVPEEFDLWGEIGDAFAETWDSLKKPLHSPRFPTLLRQVKVMVKWIRGLWVPWAANLVVQ